MPVVLYRNRTLSDADTGGQTSTVGEPSLGNNGMQIFYTGNWYATRSLDGGRTWQFVNPFTALPPVDAGFCCDQTVIYEESRDLLVWILQYIKQAGTNTLRIAVKRGATLGDDDWYWWDLQPVSVNSSWTNQWFDYNHAATSDNFLYVGSNVFTTTTDQFTRSVILRFPLDALQDDATPFTFSYFAADNSFSLRCVQGASDIMYFASHNSFSQIRLFSWPEESETVSASNVDVSLWSSNQHYSAPGPDGTDWLSRCDPRITGGWLADGVLGFAWSVNRFGNRPFPHVRVVRIDATTRQLIDEPDIWNRSYAFAYPALSPNARGMVGISLFRGGGEIHPGHVVGVRDEKLGKWVLKGTRNGSNGPNDGKWGDYLQIAPYSARGNSWLASGFTLQSGGLRTNIEPQLVQFYYREP